jgi:hypothetical protein
MTELGMTADVEADDFTDELSDEALDRGEEARLSALACGHLVTR